MVQGSKVNEITVGGVTISIWTATEAPASHHDLFTVDVGAPVDDDWVCVGGGGRGNQNPLNTLTASFPSDDFKSWNISSRDHIDPAVFPLVGFAIGMKIPPLSKQELISNLQLKKNASISVPHPEISSSVDDGFLLLGGGFQVLDQIVGNLGTGSYPDSSISWRAHSKDHREPSPSRITAFAIGIRSTLTKANGSAAGTVLASFNSFERLQRFGIQVSTVSPLAGYALCGGGAAAHGHPSAGMYLFVLEPALEPITNPTNQTFIQRATHGPQSGDNSPVTVYAMGIKFVPSSGPGPTDPCDKQVAISDASAIDSLASFAPPNVVDGNPNTKWVTISTPNPWIRLHLAQKPICKVDILWADDEPYEFNIGVSLDNQIYTDVLTNVTRTGASTTQAESYRIEPAQNVNHIQITVLHTGSPANKVEISEIRVFST